MVTTRFLARPEGRLAYDVAGAGRRVVCVPGLGDTRAEYRLLAPRLVAAGFEVATVDLRGHGESDATFTEYSRPAVGDDLLALLAHLGSGGADTGGGAAAAGRAEAGGPAHVVGCSVGASAAVWAAAVAPALVGSLTLIGPFVREVPMPTTKRLGQAVALRALLTRPWGPKAWAWWYAKLYPGAQPADLDDHRAALVRNLAEPGRLEAARALASSSVAEVEARLAEVRAPTTVIMGTADPDFPDAGAEARWVADRLGGEAVLVEGAGHYPHVEQPERTAAAMIDFLTAAAARI